MVTKTNNRMIDGAAVNILDFGAVPLTGTQCSSTEELDDGLDSTSAIQAAVDSIPINTSAIIQVPGLFGLKGTVHIDRRDVNFEGVGIDQQSSGFKWIAGRQITNFATDMFLCTSYRFAGFRNMRIVPPACYAPTHNDYDARSVLRSIFNLRWRQEEGDAINTSLRFRDLYIGRYDKDGWGSDFNTRYNRHASHGFICDDEAGFNNDGNNDFHEITNVIMYNIDTAFAVENRQNLGWRIRGLQFFFGSTVLRAPKGGIHYFDDLWVAGSNGPRGVFRLGTNGSTGEISEIYIDGFNCERIQNNRFIEVEGDSAKFHAKNGRTGFRTKTDYGQCFYVFCNDTVRTEFKFENLQIEEDTASGDTPEWRLYYDTNSKMNSLTFTGCRGSYYEHTLFQTGGSHGWTVDFNDRAPSLLTSREDIVNPSTSYRVSYLWDTGLRNGSGLIPLSNLYEIAYEQQYNGIGIGKHGVDALTVIDSVSYRLRPTTSSAFFLPNVIKPNMRVIGISANFVYNDTSAGFFRVESPDGTFVFGEGLSTGTTTQRNAALTNASLGFYSSDSDQRILFRGYSDVAGGTAANFSAAADSQTVAVTVHYISLDRTYVDIDEYNKQPITSGV